MSIHFAPQWVKPIKPSGVSSTPAADSPPTSAFGKATTPVTSNIPFPALSQSQAHAPTIATVPNPLSYSRVTHTPQSPAYPDNSYFPHTETNSNGEHKPFPFRYGKEKILAMWDEDKCKETPIELVQLADDGAAIVSRATVRPIGLRETTEIEKRLLASSVHPPAVSRARQGMAITTMEAPPSIGPGGRQAGRIASKDTSQANGRPGGFGGFGKGEGGAFGMPGRAGSIGGGVLSPGAERMPGSLGGGFGGVGRRVVKKVDPGDSGDPARPASISNWRPSRTLSGNFEGVLGFASTSVAQPQQSENTPPTPVATSAFDAIALPDPKSGETAKHTELKEKEASVISFGNGGGPGWGTGQKKWRLAAGLVVPQEPEKHDFFAGSDQTREDPPESAQATASQTPVPERDATVSEIMASVVPQSTAESETLLPSRPQDKDDLGGVQWFYRDPNGLEQGPFDGKLMHDWYALAYFTDNLPVRRDSESVFHTLVELKSATGNGVQPFLSPIRPRVPPNLPISSAPFPSTSDTTDAFATLSVQSSAPLREDRYAPPPQQAMTQHFMPHTAQTRLSDHYAPHPPYNQPHASPLPYAPHAWGGIASQAGRMDPPSFPAGPLSSPIGSASLPYQSSQQSFSPAIGAHRESRPGFFSPGAGVGALPQSAWDQPPWTAPISQISNVQQIPIPQWTQHGSQHQYHVESPVPDTTPRTALSQPERATEGYPALAASDLQSTDEIVEAVENEISSSELVPTIETPPQIDTPPVTGNQVATLSAPVSTPVSVWGQSTLSGVRNQALSEGRQSSLLPLETTPAQSPPTPKTAMSTSGSTLPPAPASLPAKPVPARHPSMGDVMQSPAAEGRIKSAPWASAKEDAPSSGLSLRDIQQAEVKEAESRKALRPQTVSTPSATPLEETIQNMTWGLPAQGQKTAAAFSAAVTASTAPVWGSGESTPKKTLKQIQEEEENRRTRVAALVRAVQSPTGPVAAPKRGYADLAATTAANASAGALPGWTTIGAGGKGSTPPAAVVRAAIPAKPTTSVALALKPSPLISAPPTTITQKSIKINGNSSDDGPSPEFIRWTKSALTGLSVPLDDFVAMLLTFPIDPPVSERQGQLEIIADSVYASSSTLDGRRFAQEFHTRRKTDAARPKSVSAARVPSGTTSLADVVKIQPKQPSADAGFKVVKSKGKKKA